MNPSPTYWLHPSIGGDAQITAQVNEAPIIMTVERVDLRRTMTKYRSIAIQARELIEFSPVTPPKNPYHRQPDNM